MTKFQSAYRANQRRPTARGWFALGCLLEEAYEENRALAASAVNKCGLDPAAFTPLFCWHQAVSLEPDYAEAWLRLGRNYREVWDDLDKARPCFEKCVDLEPGNVEALVGLGFIALPGVDEALTAKELRSRVMQAEAHLARALIEGRKKAIFLGAYEYLVECANRRVNPRLGAHWCAKAIAEKSLSAGERAWFAKTKRALLAELRPKPKPSK